MKRRYLESFLILMMILLIAACSKKNSSFSILFIDVGQGDSALVECDGHYMLIDGGDVAAGDKVYDVLKEREIQRLDILVLSHLHADHIGGLIKALSYATSIKKTISNATEANTQVFRNFEHQLNINGSEITVPHIGEKYSLGSAEVEVVDISSEEDNDSLVILITYGEKKFLFTGDIEEKAQTRISDKYSNDGDKTFKIDLMKMPHHGAYKGTLYRFVRTFMPDYAIISVGDNIYGHPDEGTINLLNNKELKAKLFRTDLNGDIIVKSNGKDISVEPENKY